MNKVSEKTYQLPLQEKIIIVGSRVITSAQPHCKLENNQLSLSDQWVIQLIYTTSQKDTPPQLLEFPLAWEEVWPWDNELLNVKTAKYLKKPQIQKMQILAAKHSPQVLQLFIQTPLSLETKEAPAEKILSPQPAAVEHIPPSVQPEQPAQSNLAPVPLSPNYQELEDDCRKLSQALTELEQRVKQLEEAQTASAAKLAGYVVDSFRLGPVPKAIFEVFASGSEDLLHKAASNNQGYFVLELPAGNYDIKVKHPRYQPLIMKSYPLVSGENKTQDFILKRI